MERIGGIVQQTLNAGASPKESPDRSRGSYRKAALIEKYGADVPLPDLLHMIGASCPKMDALGNDPCGAHYRGL